METTFYGTDYEKITVSSSAVSLNADKVAGATRALLVIEASGTELLRMRYDAVAPTASTGSPWSNGQSFVLEGRENLERFQAIRAASTDITLHVHYESPNPADIPVV